MRNYFNQAPKTFEIILPVNWEHGVPSPLVLDSVKSYAEILPKVKEFLSFEGFTFLVWSFQIESWIREASIKINPLDGSRILDMNLFRANKLRYLLKSWTLTNSTGAIEPLETVSIDGRQGLSDGAMTKVGGMDSNLMFLVLGTADQVLNGIIPVSALFLKKDFEELANGIIPERLQGKEAKSSGPTDQNLLPKVPNN